MRKRRANKHIAIILPDFSSQTQLLVQTGAIQSGTVCARHGVFTKCFQVTLRTFIKSLLELRAPEDVAELHCVLQNLI